MSLLVPAQVGAQLYTVRKYTENEIDLRETLRRIAEIGYKSVQLSAVAAMEGDNPQVTAEMFKDMLQTYHLFCPGAHNSLAALKANPDAEIAKLKTIGCHTVAIAWVDPKIVESPQLSSEFIKDATEMQKIFTQAGIKLAIHNHAHDAKFADKLVSETDLAFEVDVFWIAKAGLDPAQVIAKHPGKVSLIHLKDRPINGAEGFAAVGEGDLDFTSIIENAKIAGTKDFIVEQDTCPRDEFDCLRSSFVYLTQ